MLQKYALEKNQNMLWKIVIYADPSLHISQINIQEIFVLLIHNILENKFIFNCCWWLHGTTSTGNGWPRQADP